MPSHLTDSTTLSGMADYEVSAAYIDSLMRVLRAEGKLAAVAQQDGRLDALFANPWSSNWQPAELLELLTDCTTRVCGEAFVEEMAFQSMKQRFGGIVLPLLKASVAAGPQLLFPKLDGVVKVAIKGAHLSWKPEGETAGVFTVSYPRAMSVNTGLSWRGVIRFIFDVTGKTSGRIEAQQQTADGHAFEYRVAW